MLSPDKSDHLPGDNIHNVLYVKNAYRNRGIRSIRSKSFHGGIPRSMLHEREGGVRNILSLACIIWNIHMG